MIRAVAFLMRALFLFSVLISPTFSIFCPPEYFLIGERKCVNIFWTPATHWEAEKNCTAVSGTLVTIKNAEENQAIVHLMGSSMGITAVWLGLTCFGNSSSTCFWDDGSGPAATHSNFMTTNQWVQIGRCTELILKHNNPNQGKWMSTRCFNGASYHLSFRLPYLCEAPPTIHTRFCVNNYNGYCYYTSTEVLDPTMPGYTVSGTKAEEFCNSYGASLASIHSKMEVDYIRNLYRNTPTYYIYIGGKASNNNKFAWLDGSGWDFDYMGQVKVTKGKCLIMDVQGYGLWSQADCDQRFEFLCKEKIRDPTASASEIATQDLSTNSFLEEHLSCNSTLFLAPGAISTFGYANSTPSYCTWQLATLGPYRMGIFFEIWETNGKLTIFDEYGKIIGQFIGISDKTPYSIYTPFNVATATFEPIPGATVDRGFRAVVLPL